MIHVLVQASSRSWQGWEDFCTNHADGKPAVQYTVDKFLHASPEVKVTLIAPNFDRAGMFPLMFEHYNSTRFQLHFSHDASPLLRMLAATEMLADHDYFIRVDGLHFATLEQDALTMLAQAQSDDLDCMKFPDDFPIQFTADIYRVGSLRKLAKLNPSPEFSVHPKYAMLNDCSNWKVGYIPAPRVTDDYLSWARNVAKTVYVPRTSTNENANKAGDLHTFHYDHAKEYLKTGERVLDCSSGCGEGSLILGSKEVEVYGGDIDAKQVKIAEQHCKGNLNIKFQVVDITQQPFEDHFFDTVVCLETIEHVNEHNCLKEINRVLKPGGLAIISTPQNSLGHIPINIMHEKEYSLAGLVILCEKYFDIEKIIGIKQGRIIIDGSEKGNNMMLFCRKH